MNFRLREAVASFVLALLLSGCGGSPQPGDGKAAALQPQTAGAIGASSTRHYANGMYIETGPASVPAQVYRLYRAAFGRDADPQGLGYQVGQIEVFGHSLLEVAGNFIASPEFKQRYGTNVDDLQFVFNLYENVLNRGPDLDGQSFWMNALAAGHTRAEVLIGFSESNEFKTDAAHQGHNALMVAAGLTFQAYPASRVYLTDGTYVETNPEGTAAQVYRLYQAAFNRVADTQGLGFQIAAIETSGLPPQQVAQNFINSPEFQQRYGALDNTAFITQLYQNVLHRAPEADGLAFWLNALATGHPRAEVLLGFSDSQENRANTIGAISAGIHFLPYPRAPLSPPVDPLAPLPPFGIDASIALWGVLAEGVGGDSGGDGGAGGSAGDGAPLGGATVVLVDAVGHTVSGRTDANGRYLLKFNTSVFVAPYVVKVIDARGTVLSSTTADTVPNSKVARVNVNPLTDKVTSDVLDPSVGGTDKPFNGANILSAQLPQAKANMATSISSALSAVNTSSTNIDVVGASLDQNGGGLDAIVESVIHERDPVSGVTRLRVKQLNPDDGVVYVTANTPLQAAQVVTATSPALSLAKLTPWMNFVNACLAQPAPGFTATDGVGNCTMSQLAPAVNPAYKDAGGDFGQLVEVLYDSGGAFIAGAQLRNPQVLYVDRYPGSNTDDMAVVEFTVTIPRAPDWYQQLFPTPVTGPFEDHIDLAFKREDGVAGLSAGNWRLMGDQRSFNWFVWPSYEVRKQLNAARNANSAGNFPSSVSSGLNVTFNAETFATRQAVLQGTAQADDVYAVRITGPGLPGAGLVLARFSASPGSLCIHNKTGVIPAPGTTCSTQGVNGAFTISQVALPGGAPIASALWGGTNTGDPRSPAFAAAPTGTDFTQMQPLSVYTAQVYRTSSPTPVVEKFRMVPALLSPMVAAQQPANDFSSTFARLTPANAGASSFSITWTRTPGALFDYAEALSFTSLEPIAWSPLSFTGYLYGGVPDYFPDHRADTSITLTQGTPLPAETASDGRGVQVFSYSGRAAFFYRFAYVP